MEVRLIFPGRHCRGKESQGIGSAGDVVVGIAVLVSFAQHESEWIFTEEATNLGIVESGPSVDQAKSLIMFAARETKARTVFGCAFRDLIAVRIVTQMI